MKMAGFKGFNGKVKCIRDLHENFCLREDTLEFTDGYALQNDGIKTCYFSSFSELNSRYNGAFKLVTEEFTKADLRTGMWIEKRTGDMAQILLGTKDGDIYSGETWGELERYNNDLTCKYAPGGRFDIINVYQPLFNSAYKNFDKYKCELLYHRPEPRKITKEEATKICSDHFEETVLIEG